MDETAVYLNCSPNRTVHMKGEKTVAATIGIASSARFTLAVTVSTDGMKLPLFVIFKDTPRVSIEKKLPAILSRGIVGCVQRKAWIDERSMNIWYSKIYRLHIGDGSSESGILIDNFVCHKSDTLKQVV